MKHKEIRKLADEWVNTLRLGEYKISFFIKDMVTLEEEVGVAVHGYCESSAVHLATEISLLDPRDPNWMADNFAFDATSLIGRIEEVLVHELCHIFFRFNADGENRVSEEGSVVRLSKALIKMKYTDPLAFVKKTRKGQKQIQPIRIEGTIYPKTTTLKKDL